ncbi:MAG: hypothetical protein J5762_02775 [Clostridia bacterium]|nr:hypothetical protein [Clostridia bacterium]
MTEKEVKKKLFIEVDVDVLLFPSEMILLTSVPEGVYDEFDDWGGLNEIW